MAFFLPYIRPEPLLKVLSHLLTFLVAQLQFLREGKLSDRRLYEALERRLLICATRNISKYDAEL